MDLLTLMDWSPKDISGAIELAIAIKKNPEKYSEKLRGKTLAMIFEKTSTRTRLSFEAGMTQLGGHAIYLDPSKTQLAKAELKDEIKCMEKYVDAIMARVYEQKKVEEMAGYAAIPVINGLSDHFHPCQALADLTAIKEKFGTLKGIKVAYIGDGNNVCNSLIIGAKKVGLEISVAVPLGYEPLQKVVSFAGKSLTLSHDPAVAAKGADVVYTDTWISMGQEAEKAARLAAFKGFTVTKKLLGKALFMHCLPAYRGYEVAPDVIDGKQSIIYQQAENRLYAQNAVLLNLLGVR